MKHDPAMTQITPWGDLGGGWYFETTGGALVAGKTWRF